MLITCTNIGCLQQTEAKLDINSNKVYCEACGKEITNLTESMKRILKSNGQVLRQKNKKAFQVYCSKCKENVDIVIDNKEAICSKCGNILKISQSFIHSLNLMEAVEKEVEDE